MVDLIDKAKVKEIVWKKPRWSDPGNALNDVWGEICELPTVEAIPVEWLKAHMVTKEDILKGYFFEDEAMELNMYVEDLIGQWKAERKEE